MWCRSSRRRSLVSVLVALAIVVLGAAAAAAASPPTAATTTTTTTTSSCPPDDAGWEPECWAAAAARISFGVNRTLIWVPYASSRWGNTLSPYWQARGLAALAGHRFDAFDGFRRDWLRYLPAQAPPPPPGCPDPPRFAAACAACADESWEYAHRCPGAWTAIRPAIQADTHAALARWFAARNRSLPRFGPRDVAIQFRCARDTLLSHPEFGPAGFSYYSRHVPRRAAVVSILRDPGMTFPPCLAILDALRAHLARAFPAARVRVAGASRARDFASLALAPAMLRDSQSSFGLWAGVANRGRVWSAPLLPHFAPLATAAGGGGGGGGGATTPDLGATWHWVRDAPVLYPGVAAAAGITDPVQQVEGLLHWLRTH